MAFWLLLFLRPRPAAAFQESRPRYPVAEVAEAAEISGEGLQEKKRFWE